MLAQLAPPLPTGSAFDRITLFLRNDSPDTPLSFLRICCPSIVDPDTEEFVAAYQVWSFSESPIPPGGSQAIFVDVFDAKQTIAGVQFTVVIGAVGETTANGQGVSTISPQLQAVLDSAAQEAPGQ